MTESRPDSPAAVRRLCAERLSAQWLSGRQGRTPVEVVGHLLAVQAQDPRGARLAIRSRSEGLHSGDVDRALTADRSVLITWLNRGTLHLVRAEDYPWLHALTAPPTVTGNARRLAQEGVSPAAADRGVAVIGRALTEDGPLTRDQLRDRLRAAGVPVDGQALVHVLFLASAQGLVVRGPVLGSEQTFVTVRDWLGTPKPVDRDVALTELARRYLAGHGPATERDLARWSGLPLRDSRRGLAALGSRVDQRDDGLLDLAGSARSTAPPPPRLLGSFDPVLLGWTSREMFLGPHSEIVTVNGIFRPFALVRGRAAGTWVCAGGTVEFTPFAPLPARDASALAADAADVERFLAPPRT